MELVGSIEVHQLSKRFGEVQALNCVSFKIREGSIVGIVGQNGAGKTTLMRILSGVMRPDEGEVTIAGFNLRNHRRMIKRITGILPESGGVYEKLSIQEYLNLIGGLYGLSRQEVKMRITRLMKELELFEIQHRLIETLSKGQRQKVSLVAALVNKPIVLLLDEPTTALDPKAQRTVMNIIEEYSTAQRSVLIATHLLENVERICDQIIFLHEGEVLFSGKKEEFKAKVGEKTMEDAYLAFEEQLHVTPAN